MKLVLISLLIGIIASCIGILMESVLNIKEPYIYALVYFAFGVIVSDII